MRVKNWSKNITQVYINIVCYISMIHANVLKAAMRMYLNHRRQKAQKTHGKTSVKKLVGEGVGVSSIEVTDGNIKSFERVARKYNVDFAVKKDKTTDPPKYVVFFKGRDADAVAQAFKEFVYGNEKRKGRTLKKRLAAFAKKYPDLCRLEKSNVQGGVSYELAKSRLSIRFLPPYSEERRQKASEYAKKHGLNSQQG